MTIQIHEIILPYSKMSAEEQMELVERMRHNKYVLKPAIKRRVQKKAEQTAKRGTKKVTNMIDKLTPEQKLALLMELENG